MNLVDSLLKADVKKVEELETGVYKSKRLAKIINAKTETVDVTIQEVKSRRVNDIIAYQFDKKGQFDYNKGYDAKLIMCTEGIVEPDLKNKELQAHFSCANARELAEKLFGFEVNEISDAITALSVSSDAEGAEEEIKN